MSKVVKPYQEEGSKKKQVGNMFDNIAPYYDFLNRFLSLGIDTIWRKKMIAELNKKQPKVVMDMATGTGDVALEIAKRTDATRIVGVDLSPQMLEIGKKKVKKAGKEQLIEMYVGDSENLSFETNTFDGVTVAFGVRNYENLEKGLQEMNRVLKPGGELVVLEFSRPSIFPFKQLFNTYFKYILPNIGKLTSKDPKAYSYLYESVQAFPDGDDFLEIMKKNGYKNTTRRPLTLGICTIYKGEK